VSPRVHTPTVPWCYFT